MTQQIYNIPAANMEKLEGKIAKLNKKAKKAGTGEITLTVISKLADTQDDGSVKLTYQVAIDGETPKIEGWAFISKINHNMDPTGESNLVYDMPGTTFPEEYRKAKADCEHCGYTRKRRDTYILLNDEGDHMQVGRTCIQDFIGVDPEKVVAQAERYVSATDTLGEATGEGWGMNDHRTIDLYKYLAYVSKNIREFGWISGKDAFENGKVSTAVTALDDMFWQPPLEVKTKPTDEDKALAVETIDHVKALVPGDNSYLHNIITIAAEGYLDGKATGLAASMIAVYNRHLEYLAKQAAAPDLSKSQYVGKERERITVSVTVIGKRWFDGHFGSTALVRMVDSNSNLIITFTTGKFADTVEIGDNVAIKGTVKKHEEYKGVKQTALNRVVEV